MHPSAILPLEGTADGPTKKSYTVEYLQITTASCQITCTIPWLSCEQLPYPPEYPRISRIRRRDKSNLPLPILSYKYFLLGYSFSIASFYSPNSAFLAAALFESFKNSNKNFLQQLPSFWSSPLRGDGHQFRRSWGQHTVTPQCYGCINHMHNMSIIFYSKHIMIIIYLEPCHSMQKCDLNCLNRLPMLMFEWTMLVFVLYVEGIGNGYPQRCALWDCPYEGRDPQFDALILRMRRHRRSQPRRRK